MNIRKEKPTVIATVIALLRPGCPLVRAAAETGDPKVLAAVARYHPPMYCPAARRERPRPDLAWGEFAHSTRGGNTVKPRPCQSCEQPATEHLTVRFRYPRAEFTPDAVDPHYVHGGDGIRTCGSPACEAEALLACRARIISDVRKFSGRELDGSELETTVFRPELIIYAEQPDGTMRESWPSPPGEVGGAR